MEKRVRYSTTEISCTHCGRDSVMRILATVNDFRVVTEEDTGEQLETGDIYELLKCPKCDTVVMQVGFWHDYMDPSDWSGDVVYPPPKQTITDLPELVRKEYEAARAVAHINANAYGVLMGRVLDAVCTDRKADGGTLYEQLNDLAKKQEIPAKLVDMAHGVRQLRNVGAHASLGSLSTEEVPVLEALCKAILEYVYRAPKLIALLDQRIKALNAGRQS